MKKLLALLFVIGVISNQAAYSCGEYVDDNRSVPSAQTDAKPQQDANTSEE